MKRVCDVFNIIALRDAMLVVFSPASVTLSADENGAAKSYPKVLASLRNGASPVTSGVTWKITSANNITATITSSGYITLSGMAALYTSATVKVTATYDGSKYDGTLQIVKVKDGKAGEDGTSPLLITANPETCIIPCTSDGTPKVTSVTSAISVTRNGEDVISTNPLSPGGSSNVTGSISGNKVTLSGFTADTGYYEVLVGTGIRQIHYTKVKDGGAHSYQIVCPSVTVYITTAGTMKSSEQTYQAQFLIDGVAQTGVTWSIPNAYGISASVSSTGLVTISNYEASDQYYFKLSASMSGIPTQTITVPVGVVSDGEQALSGVAGDTMLYKGEWKEGQTYKKHYELNSGSKVYFTDYVSCGIEDGMAVYYICKANNTSSTSTKPGTNATYWTKFVTAEAVATRLIVSNQIQSNIIEAVNLTARDFWAETLNAKTINANNATFKNLIVDGYFRSSFQEVNLNYEDTTLGTGAGNLFVKDQLNILVAKGSGDEGLDRLSIYLPNNGDYIGARVLVYVSPNITDLGSGSFTKKNYYANIASGFYWDGNALAECSGTDANQFKWFLNTETSQVTENKTTGVKTYYSSTDIKLWGGFMELIGTRYTIQSGTYQGEWCRWMVLNVQSPDDVEYTTTLNQ